MGGPAPTEIIEVAAGLVFHERKLLITQRPTTGHLANLWEFPGGKRELNESFDECLHRELKEELAIEISDLNLVESIQHTYVEKTVFLKFFTCRLASGSPVAVGCQDFEWITKDELGNFKFPAADARLILRLRSSDGFWQTH